MMSKYNWKPKLDDLNDIISTALNWEKQKLKILHETYKCHRFNVRHKYGWY